MAGSGPVWLGPTGLTCAKLRQSFEMFCFSNAEEKTVPISTRRFLKKVPRKRVSMEKMEFFDNFLMKMFTLLSFPRRNVEGVQKSDASYEKTGWAVSFFETKKSTMYMRNACIREYIWARI